MSEEIPSPTEQSTENQTVAPPVAEEKIETPVIETPATEPTEEKRNYLKRFFGFDILDDSEFTFIQGSPYILPDNRIEVEGWVKSQKYRTLDELLNKFNFNDIQKKLIVDKINKFINSP